MNETQTIINIKDDVRSFIDDSVNSKKRDSQIRPKGFVEIFDIKDGKKEIIGKPNLVVYPGREWLISRAFNQANSGITALNTDYISWFGVGDGGAPVGDPLIPTSPTNIDTNLSNSIMINVTDSACGDYRTSPATGYYKHPFDEIAFEQDGDNDNYWLIAKIAVTLSSVDANGYNLNEAGLFISASNAGGYSGNFSLYARVTFPSIVKTTTRQLLFQWYVYF